MTVMCDACPRCKSPRRLGNICTSQTSVANEKAWLPWTSVGMDWYGYLYVNEG